MKKIILAAAVLALAGAQIQNARAGDQEWATAGKVLTGLVAASVIVKAVDSHASYYPANCTYATPGYGSSYSYCPPPPMVVCAPPPVFVHRAPVCVAPPPVVRFHFSYSGGHYHRPDHHRW